jgi:DNA-directed RNA polymerase subunit RPC12/RpoP
MSQDNTTKCHRCGGAGRLRIDEPESNGGQISAVCDRCGGSGRTSQTTEARWAVRCPECFLNWWLFPPVAINGQPLVRCIECKTVYPEEVVNQDGQS